MSEYRHPLERDGRIILCGCGPPPFQNSMWVEFKGFQPIVNLPPGAKVRLRATLDSLLEAFVKSPEGISRHLVYEVAGQWELAYPPEEFNVWARARGV